MKVLVIGALLPALAAARHTMCSFLPQDQAPVITYELPLSALSNPILDLPIEFRGLSPIVTRQQLKHGETPKVTIQRYSSVPDIFYDDLSEKVVITSAGCSGVSAEGSSSGATGSTKSAFFCAAAGLLASMTSSPVVANVAMAAAGAGLVPFAKAQEDICMPVVQVVIQAPSAYKGAVEICLEEINDPSICPDPFPTYPTCDDPAPTCKIAVVGAGAGGLYTALR
jgi:hypothetical protein